MDVALAACAGFSVSEPEALVPRKADRASVGAYEQGAKAQTLWEKIEASKEELKQNGISPELKKMLNDMAQRQAQLEKLKGQAPPGPSASGDNPF